MRLGDLHERRAELFAEIQRLANPLARADGHDIARIEKAVNRLHAERAEVEEAARVARREWEDLVGPWRAAVAIAAQPLLEAHARQALDAAAEVQAEAEFFRDAGARFPWLVAAPPQSPSALWTLKTFCRRLLGEVTIEMSSDPVFHGYAFCWDDFYQPAEDWPHRQKLARGALDTRSTKLHCHHLTEGDDYGGVESGNLEIWEDSQGIACQFSIPADRYGAYALMRGINDRSVNGLSFCFTPYRNHREIINGEEIEIITLAVVHELSIVPTGSCYSARCWPADASPYDLPFGLRLLAESFEEGLVARARRNLEQTDREAADFNSAARLHPGCFPSAPMPQQGRRGHASRAPPATFKFRPPQELLDRIDAILAHAATLRGRQ